ncbi:MAG: hypothetical protein AMK73_08045 [Planctomycetes bacterium SM23_32]|nr:MAG: hypothetical protein AMK73_08045 [Planctomycetes bacterium SM23_32]
MNERISEMAPESEEPRGGIPQSVADDIAVLAAELKAAEKRAATGWKVTAVVWVILLAVIAGYLYALVYRPLKDRLEAEAIIQMGVSAVNNALAQQGVPDIESPQLASWAAGELKRLAPQVMQERVKPRLLDLQDQLPALRAKYAAQIRLRAPDLMDEGVAKFESDLLPRANEALVSWLDQKLDELLDQVDEDLNRAISQMVADVTTNVDTARDPDKMRAALSSALEEAMGPIMDQMFENLDEKVATVRGKMRGLVRDYWADNLSQTDKLELRLVQLVRALFSKVGREQAEEPGAFAELRALLEGIEMPGMARMEIQRRAALPEFHIEDVDLSNVPADQRDNVRAAIEAGRKMAAAAAGAAAAPSPPSAAEEAMREAARKAAEAAAKRGAPAGVEGQAGPPSPEEIEALKQRAIEAAKKAAEGMPTEAQEAQQEAARKAAEAAAKRGAPAGVGTQRRGPSPEEIEALKQRAKEAAEKEAGVQ